MTYRDYLCNFFSSLAPGTVEINNFLSLYDLRILIKHELDKRLIPRSYRFLYRGSICATRQESFRKAWECLPRCALSVVKVEGQEGTNDKKRNDKKDAPNSYIDELVRVNLFDSNSFTLLQCLSYCNEIRRNFA